jgi:glycosyltransferase involved in cell wall biosynthesis
MVTRNRAALARRALQCLADQTWPALELVIVDDGDESYEPVLAPFRHRFPIVYHRTGSDPSRRLGALRNTSLDLATGDYCIQWDDDDWYHPERVRVQMAALDAGGLDAVLLRETLMHLDSPEFRLHPFRTELRRGTPGSILHRRTDVRYPNLARGEDSVYRRDLARRLNVGLLPPPHAHLFIRCFHGANTWDARHFTERLHYTWRDRLDYVRARWWRGNLLTHPRFMLTAIERAAFDLFLDQSRTLGLLATG